MIILIRFYLYIAQCSLFIPYHSASWKYFYVCVFAFFFASFESVRLSFIGAENGGFQRIQNFSFAMVDSFSFEKKKKTNTCSSFFSLFDLILLLNSIEFVGYFSISPWSHIDCFRIINFLFCFFLRSSRKCKKTFMKIERKTKYG